MAISPTLFLSSFKVTGTLFRPTPLLALIALFAALAFPTHVRADSRNILFIAIDDMRVDPQAITPHIDALAQQSTRYNRAYTSVPNCIGSRATIFTGISPASHGIDRWGVPKLANALYATPGLTTLPQSLSAHGYLTAAAGKVTHSRRPELWDVAGPRTDLSGFPDPFDMGPDGTFFIPTVLREDQAHPDQVITDWATAFIKDQDGSQPFFIAVGLYMPHVPWIAPEWAYDLYPDVATAAPEPGELDDEPPAAVALAERPIVSGQPLHRIVRKSGKAQAYTQAYLAATSHTDAMVGQLLTALAESPHANNTDVILWSDHGYQLGEKFHWGKQTFWEPTVRVPFLIRSPAIPAGDVDVPVSLLDLAPTVLDLAGAPAEAQFEGVSLRTGRSPVEVYVYDGRAIVAGDTKTIDYNWRNPEDKNRVRYDLANDPAERVNLASRPGS
jgi:arylsulfatase A-like enzyme